MDSHHRDWHHSWSRRDIVFLNATIMAGACGLYAVNRFWLKSVSSSWFVHGYVNDILAGALLLAYANLLIGMTPLFTCTIASPSRIAVLIGLAAMYWEMIAPRLRLGVADPLDFAAYAFGASIYYAIIRLGAPKHLTDR